jgi:hypothetical protein
MITEKQIEFCRQISLAKTASEAYRIAFKNNRTGTCKVNGSKLMKLPTIITKIKEFQDNNKRVNERANEIAAKSIADNEIASKVEKQKLLTIIMRGGLKVKRPFVISGKIMEYNMEPDHVERMKAISELNKMCGDYAPNQVGHTFNNPLPLTATKEEIKKISNALDNIV